MRNRKTAGTTTPSRIIFAAVVLLGARALLAQCTINSYYLTTHCSQHHPVGQIDISGGAPPYQLLFTNGNGYNWSMQVNSNGVTYLSLPNAATAAPPIIQVTITDSQNCTATAEAWFIVREAIFPEIVVSYPCTTAAELRWTGTWLGPGTSGPVNTDCQASHYELQGTGSSGFYETGTLSTNWIQELPGQWLYQGTLPPDLYHVAIGNLDSYGNVGGECSTHTSFFTLCPGPGTYFEIQGGIPASCYTQLSLHAALSGALSTGTTMSDALRVAGVLPTTEPYGALGYVYTGPPTSSAFSPSVFTNSNASTAIVDWVVVELRAATNASNVVYSTPALIRRDGRIVNYPMNAPTTFRTPMPPGNYFVTIRHRNHLAVMTNAAVSLTASATTLDFRSLTATYGVGAQNSVNGILALWPGDANFDGTAMYTGTNNDRDLLLSAIGGSVPTNFVSNTYSPLDINLDGSIRYTGTNNDRDIILQTIGGVIPTTTRVQQVP